MKIAMIGTGYVGLVSGVCFAEFGFETICVDKDTSRLETLMKGKSPFYEPGLDNLLNKHINVTRYLTFSSDLKSSVKNSDIVFITVGTPSKRLDNDADLTGIFNASREIAESIDKYTLIVTKSTVPVGTTQKIKEIVLEKIPKEKFDVVSNPEFLREGSAIDDFMRPDRVVIGTETKKSDDLMRKIYRPLFILETPIVSTSIKTAEIIKYASNSFLATKITFINEVADLCEATGANVNDISKAMGLDKRIGSKFLHAGPGFGGSCFPKDLRAFSSTAKKHGINLSIVDAVNHSNEIRPKKIVTKIASYYNNNFKDITLSILGLSFKPNTDDIRESTSLIIIKNLLEKNAKIKVYDPQAMENTKKIFENLIYCKNAYDACENSQGLIIATEWNEFRALNLEKLKSLLTNKVIFDLRNIYNSNEITSKGIKYFGIGI
tara:strand:+ start:985 stop:2289 length:1305 start_codon:yes stop_codon:yes gene_type:complete